MNPLSNIEIINFDELNDDEHSIDLEQEIGQNYMNNFINENYNSDYSESQSDLNYCESPCNMSFCSDNNSIFFINKMNLNDSSLNLNNSEQTACSENFKSLFLNKSFRSLEKTICNSFSYLKKPTKFKLINAKDLNNSSISNISYGNKNFACTFENCGKVYKSKENLTLHYKNIHLKEKPYSCSYCGSLFSHRNGK